MRDYRNDDDAENISTPMSVSFSERKKKKHTKKIQKNNNTHTQQKPRPLIIT